MRTIRMCALISLVFAAGASLAMPAFMMELKTTYKVKAGSNIDKAGCALCHAAKTDFKHFNAYGQDLRKLMEDAKAAKLTADIIHKADDLDSNKDGVKNGDEIKADTLPGEVRSKPAAGSGSKPSEK